MQSVLLSGRSNITKVPLHFGYKIPQALSAHAQKKTPLFFFPFFAWNL